jgi:uroporphyrinogen-III synthase
MIAVRPLAGRRVVTTREEPSDLDSLLARAGADVVNVPLIEIADVEGGERALGEAVNALADDDWLAVTSRHGARRVGHLVGSRPRVRLAAVGRATADVLAELALRPVDVTPARQTAADLVAAMPSPSHAGVRVLVAQGDRADTTFADGLEGRGFDVTVITAYRNRSRRPSDAERHAALAADAVAFASGSAALAWVESIGPVSPPVVVVIGPTTRRVATAAGLQVTHMAADHSVDGFVAEITAALVDRP